MKYRLYILLLLLVFTVVIVSLSFLDNDLETLSKVAIVAKKPSIVVNQVGYLPQWHKRAWLRQNLAFSSSNPVPNVPAKLIATDSNEVVANIELQPSNLDQNTQDLIWEIDFSAITQPGTYYLQQGKIKSIPFKIAEDVYQQPLITLLRSYYLQRCGVELDDPVTGISHAPCHLQDAAIAHQDKYYPAGKVIPTRGGWHDTGAYSKYVATTTITIARLLTLYEQYPDLFGDNQLNIPESGNGIADLLDEMEFGLDWLLKMQRPDGAVYRKLSGKKWPMGLAPDEDTQPRYLYGISTPETAKFAAVMAIASRNYQDNPQLATKYLTAAMSAWQYLQQQPNMQVDWVEGDDTGSDKYLASEFDREASLNTDIDDRLWAAVELYITTGKADFANYLASNLAQVEYTLFEWKNPAPLGFINYLEQNRQPTSEALVTQIKTKIQQRADLVLNNTRQNAYRIANDRFIWGSNKMTAEEGITLVYAYHLTKNEDYLIAAIDQLDYLLGRNHFNQTFLTDIGTNSVKNLSNIYIRAKNIRLPGLMVGGPNGDAQDGMVAKNKGQLSYIDDPRSYTTNENAIDYNASIISLIVNLIKAK